MDFKFEFYTSKTSPGTPPHSWKPKLEFKKKLELGKNYNPEGEFGFTGFWTNIGLFLMMIVSSFFLGTMIWVFGKVFIEFMIELF